MEEIYRSCPEFENNDYILRMVRQEDRLDLLKVYSVSAEQTENT